MITIVTRSVGIRAYGGEDKMRPIDKVAVSGVAGSSVGAISGLLREYLRLVLLMFLLCSTIHLGLDLQSLPVSFREDTRILNQAKKLQVAQLESYPALSHGD